ncbi:helix-turn-helix domain-containing protein [Paratractidigestivibacter sp.]|uniref:winged helix-turn-helix transcriptional regulator n=1 Tax=Paratractidigestivibacter sp. TaxID=2847316 RepID=UPI002ABD9099|nr:helix-turn-helix domain-containing protein [Paratractidigestivibacter sp.]
MDTLLFDAKNCPIARIAKVIHGKWTMVIVYVLSEGTLRFSEIHRRLPHITEANLTKDLRTLEAHGIIHREVYPVVPPKVEYSLTEAGRELLPIFHELNSWADKYTQAPE